MRSLLVGLFVLCSACQSASDSAPSAPSEAVYADVQQEATASAPSAGASAVASPLARQPDAPPGAAPDATPDAATPTAPASARVFIRDADLRLRVDDYDAARRAALAAAQSARAVVAGEAEQRYAYSVTNTLTIRVEAARFDSLMEALAAIGKEVVERRVTVEDVTAQNADLEARLRARRAVEARYLDILGRAGRVEDVLAVERQLAETREAIEVAEGQMRGLRDRVSLSTITLTLSEESATGITDGPGFVSRLADAFGTGWDVFLGLLVGLVALWPLLFLVPLGVWAWRAIRRRRRRNAEV